MFSTLMYERHNTKIAVFGGKPGENVEYKGELYLVFSSARLPLPQIADGYTGKRQAWPGTRY